MAAYGDYCGCESGHFIVNSDSDADHVSLFDGAHVGCSASGDGGIDSAASLVVALTGINFYPGGAECCAEVYASGCEDSDSHG